MARVIAKPLTYLINQSFRRGTFPTALKVAKVIPLHKSGDQSDVKNKRPVSVLSVFSKIFEKSMVSRLSSYLESHKLLNDVQHGFRQNRSTESAISQFIKPIYDALEEGESTLAIYIDYSKAFDCLEHKILRTKLDHLGIRGPTLEFLCDFLRGRSQRVFYDGKYSDQLTLKYGCVQGSHLGPLMFLVYINDLVNCTNLLNFSLYADDSNASRSGKDLYQLYRSVNDALREVYRWIKANGLAINTLKLAYMLFTNSVEVVNYQLNIGEWNIPRVDQTKLLDLVIDDKLKWDLHAKSVASKIAKTCGILYLIRKKLNSKARKLVYSSIIYPYMLYCVPIWGGTWGCHLRPVIVAQKRAVRTVAGVGRYEHTHELFGQLKLLKFDSVYTYFTSVLMYKHLNFGYVEGAFQIPQHDYNLRLRNVPIPPRIRLTLYKKSLFFSGPNVWRNLGNQFVNQHFSSIDSFKFKLKKHLLLTQ